MNNIITFYIYYLLFYSAFQFAKDKNKDYYLPLTSEINSNGKTKSNTCLGSSPSTSKFKTTTSKSKTIFLDYSNLYSTIL